MVAMMTKHRFTDAMVHDGRIRKTDDGAVVQARVARANNVQTYLGSEMGIEDREFVRVYRPAEAVFAKDAISTYARKPITLGHPDGGVSADTWKELSVGEIDRDVMRDGEFVSVPLLFRDAKTINMLQSADGPRELSMGYDAKIVMQDGVSPDGEPYDAVMSDFRMNHIAVVARARGGEELRIGDSAANWGAAPLLSTADMKGSQMADTLQTVVLGDQAAQVAVADAPKIEAFKADQAKALTDAQATHDAAIAAKDAEIQKLQGKLDAANEKVLDEAALDQRVADRADLIGKARSIVKDVDTKGLSDAAIRKAVVSSKLGDAAIKDKSDAYVEARFDALAEDAATGDPVADAMTKGVHQKVDDGGWNSILPMKKEA